MVRAILSWERVHPVLASLVVADEMLRAHDASSYKYAKVYFSLNLEKGNQHTGVDAPLSADLPIA